MALVRVRAYGSLPAYYAEEGGDDGISITFPQKRVRVKEIFTRLHIPEKAVAFVALNGVKCAKDALVADGDKVTIFPFVAGG